MINCDGIAMLQVPSYTSNEEPYRFQDYKYPWYEQVDLCPSINIVFIPYKSLS